MRGNQPGYLPTPANIATECARIRATWSDAERNRRLVGVSQDQVSTRWQPPEIATSNCMARVRSTVLSLAM
ncbi:MAG: hypothetical protein RH917_17850 [Lacipirellulaceae bacterium]